MQTRSNKSLLAASSGDQPWERVGDTLVPTKKEKGSLKSSIWRSIAGVLSIKLTNEKEDLYWEKSGATIVPKAI